MVADFAATALAMARDLTAEGWSCAQDGRWIDPTTRARYRATEAWERARKDHEREHRALDDGAHWLDRPPPQSGLQAYTASAADVTPPVCAPPGSAR